MIKKLRKQSGAALLEYGLLAALIGVSSIAAVKTGGVEIQALFQKGASVLGASIDAGPSGPTSPTSPGGTSPGGAIDGETPGPARLTWVASGEVQEALVGSAHTASYTLRNAGPSEIPGLQTADFTLSGPFELLDNGCTAPLAPGADCFVSVDFVPQSAGSVSGQMSVQGQSTPLQGVGYARMDWDMDSFSLPSGQFGMDYRATLPRASTTDGQSITYEISRLPTGLSFDSTNLVIMGTPTFTGSQEILITARSQASQYRDKVLEIFIDAPP